MNILNGCMVVTIPSDLSGDAIPQMQKSLLGKIDETKVFGLVFDFSSLKVIDSYEYLELSNLIKMTNVLGTEAIVVGINPGLVNALLDLSVDTDHLNTFLNLEDGLSYLLSKTDQIEAEEAEEIEVIKNLEEEYEELEDAKI